MIVAEHECAYDRPRDDTWLLALILAEIAAVLLILLIYIVSLVIKGPIRVKLDETTTSRWEVPSYVENTDSTTDYTEHNLQQQEQESISSETSPRHRINPVISEFEQRSAW